LKSKQKTAKFIFVDITDENSRIRIRAKISWIRYTGSYRTTGLHYDEPHRYRRYRTVP
jgi:hypothetical protein